MSFLFQDYHIKINVPYFLICLVTILVSMLMFSGEKVVYIILKLCISYLTMLATLIYVLLHQVCAILFWVFWLFECINMMSWRETPTKKNRITVEAKFKKTAFKKIATWCRRVDSKQDTVCKPIKTCACMSQTVVTC